MNAAQRIATRMLLLDRPVPERSDADVRAEADRNYSWNFAMNVLDGAAFWFGIAFASSATIVPLFVSKITLNPVVFGFVAMIAQSSWYLPQLLVAGPTERVDRKKPIVVNLGFFLERLPVWFWPISALLSVTMPIVALILFLVTYLWHGLGAGVLGPAWQDLIARCFPVNRRGRMFGLTSFIGTGMGTAGALISSRLLSRFAYPWSFVVVFGIAALAITVSWFFLALVREPEQAAQVPEDNRRPILERARSILARGHEFSPFPDLPCRHGHGSDGDRLLDRGRYPALVGGGWGRGVLHGDAAVGTDVRQSAGRHAGGPLWAQDPADDRRRRPDQRLHAGAGGRSAGIVLSGVCPDWPVDRHPYRVWSVDCAGVFSSCAATDLRWDFQHVCGACQRGCAAGGRVFGEQQLSIALWRLHRRGQQCARVADRRGAGSAVRGDAADCGDVTRVRLRAMGHGSDERVRQASGIMDRRALRVGTGRAVD